MATFLDRQSAIELRPAEGRRKREKGAPMYFTAQKRMAGSPASSRQNDRQILVLSTDTPFDTR